MRTNKTFQNLLPALIMLLVATPLWAHENDSSKKPQPIMTKAASQAGWTCPMHAEIHSHEQGKCPVCKMNLVKVKPKKAD